MLSKSYALVLLASLSGWCSAAQLKIDILELPENTPITELSSDIPTCVGYVGDINECIKNVLQSLKPRLKNGIPELNIPVLDPLVIKQLNIELTLDVGEGSLKLQDITILGISKCTVNNVNLIIEGEHVTLQLSAEAPSIQYEGYFEGELLVAFMNVKPSGRFMGNLTGLLLDIELEGDLSERDGHKYLKLTDFDFQPEIEDMRIDADNLGSNKIISSIILQIIHSHWRSLYKVLLKQFHKTWEPIALNVANSYLDAIPFDLFINTPENKKN